MLKVGRSIVYGRFKMKRWKILIMVLVALWLALEANVLLAQEHFPTLTGTVIGIQGGARKWLEVRNEADGATVSLRIGRNTTYVPSRLPNPGEKVRVMYYTEKGVNIATKVLIYSKEQTN